MPNLDINTERGQNTLIQERRAITIINSNWPDCIYAETPKDTIADVDGVLIMEGAVQAVVETKCREMTFDLLKNVFNNEWLITYHKLIKGANISVALQVPFWGFLYLVPEDFVLRIKFFTPNDGWLVPFRVAKTETQRSVNGGIAIRDNAYIPMNQADILRERRMEQR